MPGPCLRRTERGLSVIDVISTKSYGYMKDHEEEIPEGGVQEA
jgi:hypothetical protein